MKYHLPPCRGLWLWIAVFVLGCTVTACLPTISPMVRAGPLDIDGKFALSTGSGTLQSSSSTSALGLEEETVIQPRVDFDWGNLHVVGSAFQAEYKGSGAVENTLTLGGNTITIGTPTRTDLDFGFYTAHLTYDLLPVDFLFDLGIGAGLGYLDYDVAIQSKSSAARISAQDELPFGFLTARVGKEFGPFEAVGMLSGLGIEFDDEDFAYYELDAYAGYNLFGKGRMQAHVLLGYRFLGVDYEFKSKGNRVDVDGDFQGPYLGFKLRF